METQYIHNGLEQENWPGRELAATVGFFDGVHRGHRFLIEQVKAVARETGLLSAVVTFREHPQEYLQTDHKPLLLARLANRLTHLEDTGLDYCIVLEFEEKLANQTAQEFIEQTLRQNLHVRELLIGHDHRMGKNRAEGFEDYVRYGAECGMGVRQATALTDPDTEISSTAVRRMLLQGDVRKAASVLTYHYYLCGQVVHGDGMGGKFGFPTANLQQEDNRKMIPGPGIYATRVLVNNKIHQGMTYIGRRPTVVDQGELRIETHLLDFASDIYGKRLVLEFVDFIREDRKFGTDCQLKTQLQLDEDATRRILAERSGEESILTTSLF